MDVDERSTVRQKILAEIKKSEQDIIVLQELVKPIPPDNAIGRLSRMEAINAKSVNQATLSAARIKTTKLKWALAHLDEPGFGLCEECGKPIPLARILLVPESTKCVPCLEEQD